MKSPPASVGISGSTSDPGKIPHTRQHSPCVTTIEPVILKPEAAAWEAQSWPKPVHHNWRVALLTATRENTQQEDLQQE